MAGEGKSSNEFSFHLLPTKTYPSLETKDCKDNLQKWGLDGRLFAQAFTFDQEYKQYKAEKFALDFFTDSDVQRSICTAGHAGNVSYGLGGEPSSVQIEVVPCTAVSMSLFDKLEAHDIVQKDSGYIKKCFEEYIDGVPIPDQLRNVLVNEDFDKYNIYDEAERAELLFRLFTHLCIGGGVCQYEDVITPYVQHTKTLYKDLISVQKEPGSSDLHVVSQVIKVDVKDKEGDYLFPDDKLHLNSFCYLIIDPIRRHVTLLHHKYGGGLW